MEYREYGKDRAQTVMLLHGGGLSWWNYRAEAELLEDRYHVVLPILDGHAGSGRRFISIEDSAGELIRLIDRELRGSVLLIGGLSLGGQILLEMLSRRKDICRYAVVESAAAIPDPLTGALIGPVFSSSYGLIRNRAFAKAQFASLHIRQDLFEDYYRDTCLIERADMIAFLKASAAYALKDTISLTGAKVRVFAGEKEDRRILRSAELICNLVPGCEKTVLKGLRHGEFSINHPEEYVKAVTGIIKG